MGGLCPRRTHEAENEAENETETTQAENEPTNQDEMENTGPNPSHNMYNYSPSGAFRRKPRTYGETDHPWGENAPAEF
mgnify:CR=1 FL=1